jgi:hypothetical protein
MLITYAVDMKSLNTLRFYFNSLDRPLSGPQFLYEIQSEEKKNPPFSGIDPRPSSLYTRTYPKVSGLAAWSKNCKWYSSLPLGAVVSLFYETV